MIITYNKTGDPPSDPDVNAFKCYLYSEVDNEFNDEGNLWVYVFFFCTLHYSYFLTVTEQINPEDECEYLIELENNDLIRLANQIHVEEKLRWSSCRWKVLAPPSRTVKLMCSFTDKPPDPLTIQVY